MKNFLKGSAVTLVVALTAAYSIYFFQRSGASGPAVPFRTAMVNRGDMVVSISATGTVEPEEVVDVGAQVAGKIVSFGKDRHEKTIDYGSFVEKGTVLAQIDSAVYASGLAEAAAQKEQATAGVARAEADLGQLQARLVQAERDWNRAKKLGPSDALAQSQYDALQSAYEVAKANLAVGRASLLQARGAVSLAEAALNRAMQNLDYCTIRSPVSGIIIDRRVNIGQTVVSSLNAPSLFLIAKDLNRMEVWVAVNEADIGNIHAGQKVSFTVDALPGQVFQGEVGKIRLNASMTQNVVTYTVEVLTDNTSGKLLPYLTANVKLLLDSRKEVLLVSSAALRWNPEPGQVIPGSDPHAVENSAAEGASERRSPGVVWVVEGDRVRPITVSVGPSNGSLTEVDGKDIKEGDWVVIGAQSQEPPEPAVKRSPFAPSFGSGSDRRK